jgi:hypothetical protein
MSGQHDQDTRARDIERRVASFLSDDLGPRVPERVVEGALAHARAHPRHRDVLAAVRPDPMDGWAAVVGLGGGARSGSRAAPRLVPRLLLLASLGLLLVAALAVASVGGVFDRPGLVPVPSPTPSAVPTVTPSPSPSPVIQTIRVDLTELYGADAFIEVTDESGTVTAAVTGTPRDGGSTDGQSVVVTEGTSPDTVVLTWTGLPCETGHQLVIAPDGLTMTLFRTTCEGDTFPRDLVLVLTFAGPVDPADLAVTLETVAP